MQTIFLKRFFTLLGTLFILAGTSLVHAQGGGATGYLRIIAEKTTNILDRIDNAIPKLLDYYLNTWVDKEDKEGTATTTTMQTTFSKFGQQLLDNSNQQESLQNAKINSDLLNTGIGTAFNQNFNLPNPASLAGSLQQTLPYANDLLYSTFLGQPYPNVPTKKNVDQQYNYLKNASGMNLYHPIPADNWKGNDLDKSRYRGFYNTVMAAESFNAFVLSGQYAETQRAIQEKQKVGSMRDALLKQATDSAEWFSKVSSEPLGFILRQILMYQSQIFVMLNESLQTQKQLLTAQVMTNSLLIAVNQSNEKILYYSATTPGPG